MGEVVKYRSLDSNDTARFRCGALMENHMQCPTHAQARLLTHQDRLAEYLCAFHFAIAKVMPENNDLSFQEEEN